MGNEDYFVEIHTDVMYTRNLSEDEVLLIKDFLRNKNIDPEAASRDDITLAISVLHDEGKIDYYRDGWYVESDFYTQSMEYAGTLFEKED